MWLSAMDRRSSSSPVCGDRQAFAQVLRADPLRAGGNLVHRQERSLHQERAAANGDQRHDRQPDDQEYQPLAQVGLHIVHRRPHFNQVPLRRSGVLTSRPASSIFRPASSATWRAVSGRAGQAGGGSSAGSKAWSLGGPDR